MVGGEQNIILNARCGLGAAIHEIGHAVGLLHEHQRNDRDPHVWVRSNSLGSNDPLHGKNGPRGLASGPYDYGSVMHYGCLPETMVTIPPGIPCGSRVLSAGDIDGVHRLYGKTPTETTITTNPAGLLIEVDGETYTAPHRFDWKPGSKHTIGVPAPQKFEGNYLLHRRDYYRFIFAKWSDGGAQTHTVTASSETTVFIANFIWQTTTEYSAVPPQGGTIRIEPPSSDGFYTYYSFLKMFAEPAEGFSFKSWRSWGAGNGPASNPKVTSAGASHQQANFTRQPLTKIDTNVPGSDIAVDGVLRSLPENFDWEAGSTHTLGLLVREDTGHEGVIQPYWGINGERLVFDGWSDGGAETHDITISEERPTITANFRRQVLVQTVSHGPGTIEVQPSDSEGVYHDLSNVVQLTAQPAPGFKFVSWLGDLSGTENPQSLLIDSHKLVRAFFLDEQSFESAKLTSGKPFNTDSYNGYWIDVPRGATQLDIRLVTTTPGAEVDLYASRDSGPRAVYGANNEGLAGYESQYSSTGPGGNKTITITPASSPPLQPGPYFIAVHVRTRGVSVRRTLTADVTVAESEIAANIPHFGIPASLITTREGENPPPQILEIRNSGRGTLDYEIATDQPWLSVSPDQGSAMEEIDIIEIRAYPMAMEPGAVEGLITITERQPSGFAGLFSDHTPAWPVTVPVTLSVIPDSRVVP